MTNVEKLSQVVCYATVLCAGLVSCCSLIDASIHRRRKTAVTNSILNGVWRLLVSHQCWIFFWRVRRSLVIIKRSFVVCDNIVNIWIVSISNYWNIFCHHHFFSWFSYYFVKKMRWGVFKVQIRRYKLSEINVLTGGSQLGSFCKFRSDFGVIAFLLLSAMNCGIFSISKWSFY